jgi:1,4-alpha-glucan branching enzyme
MSIDTAPGDLDLHLFGQGRHRRLWEVLGAHALPEGGVRFAVWAPNAQAAQVVGDWNGWAGGVDGLEQSGMSGIWSGVAPRASVGQCYKFELRDRDGRWLLRADPMARQAEVPPRTASVIAPPRSAEPADATWRDQRAARNHGRMSVYEMHAGSWRWDDDGHPLSYRALAAPLVEHVGNLGFTHVEFMPLA